MRHDRLHEAAGRGDAPAVRHAVREGISPNAFDRDGCLPLHFAVKSGCIRTVAALIELGADPRLRTTDVKSPLAMAADARRHEMVFEMLGSGGMREEDAPDLSGLLSPLHIAMRLGRPEEVAVLIDAGHEADADLLMAAARSSRASAGQAARELLARAPQLRWRDCDGLLREAFEVALANNFEVARAIADALAPSSGGDVVVPDDDTVQVRWRAPPVVGCRIQTAKREGENGTSVHSTASLGLRAARFAALSSLVCTQLYFIRSGFRA
jgi:hypothetical protein